ncbi:hypothetical protein FJY63_04010, partial [Candidatus Sumerlaeota bacterium]|nr:hypothetical protein [Candidatus Sumerlaeota bacterium]
RLVEATAGRSPIDDPVRMLNVARPDATLFRLLNVRYLIGDVRERRLAAWPTEQDGVFTMALDKPTTITGVSLVSLLNFAEDLSDGAVVGVVIACGDEATQTAVIRAGMETSDWRVADSRFPCRHKPARKNMEWTVATRAGDVQVANYYAQVAFAKPVVARAIEIRRALPNTVLSIATVGIILPEPPGWEKVYERDRYRVYRNHDCLGGAWLVHRVREVGSEDEALSLLAKDAVDLSHEAVVSKPFKLGVLPETEDGAAASHDEVAFVRYEADKIEIRTTSSQPAMLCLAEVHYPGWRAELDGQPTELLRVNFLLRGVVIPAAGAHVVTLRFAPLSLAIGKVVSLVGVLVLVGLWIGSRTGRTGQTGPTGPTRL